MFAFFNSVADILKTVVTFVINAVEMLITVIANLFRSVTWLSACLAYLPEWLVAFVLVPISLAALLQIINKGD